MKALRLELELAFKTTAAETVADAEHLVHRLPFLTVNEVVSNAGAILSSVVKYANHLSVMAFVIHVECAFHCSTIDGMRTIEGKTLRVSEQRKMQPRLDAFSSLNRDQRRSIRHFFEWLAQKEGGIEYDPELQECLAFWTAISVLP